MTPEEALDKIVRKLPDFHYKGLLEEIQIIKEAIKKNKPNKESMRRFKPDGWRDSRAGGILSDDY